ncbi:MAG: CPBP family intramembrane metalloprotease [bacterium]|nr:CPBP family intramembrane metalloprotease [bacterium]
MAGVYMAKVFDGIYPEPVDGLHIEVLGQLMWIRLGISAVLLLRRMGGIGFGFWPTAAEWRIGLWQYLLFLPAGALLMYGLDFARFDPADGFWWKGIGTFFGILWVVALAEELFFRGMLQRWLVDWLGSKTGLVLTSLAFGAVHLPFREFPNWEFATLAALAGLFYGRAFLQGNGIRAGMVTHALVVATWRTLFR